MPQGCLRSKHLGHSTGTKYGQWRHLTKGARKLIISAARPAATVNKLRLENTASTGER
jgi:hypothetical protein